MQRLSPAGADRLDERLDLLVAEPGRPQRQRLPLLRLERAQRFERLSGLGRELGIAGGRERLDQLLIDLVAALLLECEHLVRRDNPGPADRADGLEPVTMAPGDQPCLGTRVFD